MRFAALVAILLTACSSSAPPAPAVPEWDMVPAGVLESLCSRLQMDAVTSGGTLTVVKTTQPLATPSMLASLARGASRARKVPPPSNRTIPIQVTSGTCTWKAVDAVDRDSQFDEVVVELSAPFANPFAREAGIIARVSLGGEHPAYYWIPLGSRGDQWSVGFVSVLAQ